jgi:hypothetical protein
MQDIEISISPILSNTFYFSFETSYRFGVTEGAIYTPRFFERYLAEEYENNGEITRKLSENLVHEILHKVIYEFEGETISKQFDNIAKNAENNKYLIGLE